MKVGDLVRYTDNTQHFGVIVDIDSSSRMGMLHVLWNDGDLSWLGAWKMEVYNESR